MIQNSNGSNNGVDNTFSGIKTFNDDVNFMNKVKLYDVNNTDNYGSLYYQNTRRLFIENIHSNGTISFMTAGKIMCLINQWQLNMQNNPITSVSSITFTNGTTQNTAFTTDITNNLQNQVDALNLKTKSYTYIEIPEVPNVTPYYEKMTFNHISDRPTTESTKLCAEQKEVTQARSEHSLKEKIPKPPFRHGKFMTSIETPSIESLTNKRSTCDFTT